MNDVPNTGAESCCCVIGYISKFEIRETTNFDNDPQRGFIGEIIDETGSCQFVRWDHADDKGNPLSTVDLYVGAVVMLRGRKKTYAGKPKITLPSVKEMKKWKKWGTYINMNKAIYYAPKNATA